MDHFKGFSNMSYRNMYRKPNRQFDQCSYVSIYLTNKTSVSKLWTLCIDLESIFGKVILKSDWMWENCFLFLALLILISRSWGGIHKDTQWFNFLLGFPCGLGKFPTDKDSHNGFGVSLSSKAWCLMTPGLLRHKKRVWQTAGVNTKGIRTLQKLLL